MRRTETSQRPDPLTDRNSRARMATHEVRGGEPAAAVRHNSGVCSIHFAVAAAAAGSPPSARGACSRISSHRVGAQKPSVMALDEAPAPTPLTEPAGASRSVRRLGRPIGTQSNYNYHIENDRNRVLPAHSTVTSAVTELAMKQASWAWWCSSSSVAASASHSTNGFKVTRVTAMRPSAFFAISPTALSR